MNSELELDPRWEWVEIRRVGMPAEWVRVRCNHLDVVPVESVSGEPVAQLCRTCDEQLPPPVITGS